MSEETQKTEPQKTETKKETQPQSIEKEHFQLDVNYSGTAQQYIQNTVEERQANLIAIAKNNKYTLPIYDGDGKIIDNVTVRKLDISQLEFEDLQKQKAEIDDLDKMTRISLTECQRYGLVVPPNFLTANKDLLILKNEYHRKLGILKCGVDITKINTHKRSFIDIVEAYMFQEETGLPSATNRSSSTSSSMTYR